MKRAIALLVVLTGLYVIYESSSKLRTHFTSLEKHLTSGSWKITNDKFQLYKYLKRYYEEEPGDYKVHMLNGSGYDYLLTDANAGDTFHILGEMLPHEDEGPLNRRPLNLAAEYGDFLAESTYELVPNRKKEDLDVLKMFFSFDDITKPNDSVLQRVKKIYSTLPPDNLLISARSKFDLAKPHKSRYRTFKTFTEPHYNKDSWNKRSLYIDGIGEIEVDTTMRFNGMINPISDTKNLIPVEIRSTSRLHKVKFDREWLSQSFIESKFRERGERTKRFFRKEGGLRLIPEEIWVKGNDRIIINLKSIEDKNFLINSGVKEFVITGDNLGDHVSYNVILLGKGNGEKELVGLKLPYYSRLIAVISRDRLIP